MQKITSGFRRPICLMDLFSSTKAKVLNCVNLFHYLSFMFVFVTFSLCMAAPSFAAKTFVYCSEASPKLFNPQLAIDGPTFNASARPLYNRLVTFKAETTDIEPSLARSWTISRDQKTYTFNLRKDVSFHTTSYFQPTRNFNAEDVLFSFLRMKDPKHPYHSVNGGTYSYFASMSMGELIKNIKKVDDYTVQFELVRPEAPFLADLAMSFSSILSAEYAEKLAKEGRKEDIDTFPVGTGPFIFKKYVKDSLVRYVKNDKYFKGAPKIDNMVFSIVTDPSVRAQKLKAGECQFIAEPSPEDIETLSQLPSIKIVSQPGLNVGYLTINTEKKPFNNKLVRQALNYALNRASYIKAIYHGQAMMAKNPIPPTMWSYDTKGKSYEYNPQKAKELLAKAGYPKGFETELWTLPVSRPYNPNGKKMGEMMQADLAAVGVKVKLVTYKWGEYIKRATAGEHTLLQLGWSGDNGDPDNFLYTLLGCDGIKAGSNYARWCNKKFQALVEKAKRISQMKKRTQLYIQAQRVFKEEAPWVTLAHSKVFKVMSSRVHGYIQSPIGVEDFSTIDLK